MNKKDSRLTSTPLKLAVAFVPVLLALLLFWPRETTTQNAPFHLLEATVEDIHTAYKSGQLTSRQLVQLYLNRIEAYDKKGPGINAIITVNPTALEEADRLDAAFKASGFVGSLHGIPMIVKDQMDVKGMPTTLGSVLFKDYRPEKDSFVAEKLRKAGAIIIGKATLGELGGGDTFGSLYGATRNPYDLDRTVGGSSGGSGAGTTANFSAVAVGQEGFASIRRPSAWNSIVGIRPTAGLVSRTGVFDGWPQLNGSLGPMARTVSDVAKLLDVLVGYDPEDPVTALGVGHIPESYTKFLDVNGLKGARIGILRESMGFASEPQSQDFAKITSVFDRAVGELRAAGATLVDPIVIPKLKESLAKRAPSLTEMEEAFKVYFGSNPSAPFKSFMEMVHSPDFSKVVRYAQIRLQPTTEAADRYQYLMARDELMINVLKVMADNKLDAIVHKAVEHQPTLIKDGMNPPWTNTKGIPFLNTFLVFVPAIAVPAGFTTDNLPAGITFMARPYDEATVIKLAYAYEQATHHRRPPGSTPKLANEP